jgi:hypothetical protein
MAAREAGEQEQHSNESRIRVRNLHLRKISVDGLGQRSNLVFGTTEDIPGGMRLLQLQDDFWEATGHAVIP